MSKHDNSNRIRIDCAALPDPATAAMHPGDLDRMFRHIADKGGNDERNRDKNETEMRDDDNYDDDDMPEYTVTVHSWPGDYTKPPPPPPPQPPSPALEEEEETGLLPMEQQQQQLLVSRRTSRPPWVISLDGLLSADECQALIELDNFSGTGQPADQRKNRSVAGSF